MHVLPCFDLGIDDYLTKPFSPKELIARIKALTNRTSNNINVYKLGSLEVNFSSHYIKIDNNIINVTPKEFEILSYLIKNKEIAISREQLLSNVWGYDFFGDDRTVDTHIKMLRNSLGKYRDHIKTVRGIGYRFVENENERFEVEHIGNERRFRYTTKQAKFSQDNAIKQKALTLGEDLINFLNDNNIKNCFVDSNVQTETFGDDCLQD